MIIIFRFVRIQLFQRNFLYRLIHINLITKYGIVLQISLYKFISFLFCVLDKIYPNLNLQLFSENNLISNFKVQCIQCDEKYQLQLASGKCQFQFCENQCFRCDLVNGNVACELCPFLSDEINFIQFQNKCIRCQQNCKACFVRSLSEISLINPFYQFDNRFEDFIPNYQCYKYEQIEEKFYDSQIAEFVDCKIYPKGCEKQLIVKVNFTCHTLNNRLFEFVQPKSQISGLHIKTIIFQMISYQSLTCKIQENLKFQQSYSSEILSAINVKLILNFTYPMIWEIYNNITFVNFINVEIYGLQIKIANANLKTQIIFFSLGLCSVSFTNLSITRIQNQSGIFDIEIFNSPNITLTNCSINQLMLNKQNGIFIFHPTAISKQSYIIDLSILNCRFEYSTILNFQLNQKNDYIELKLFAINSLFLASQIFTIVSKFVAEQLHIHDIILKNTEIHKSFGLIPSSNFQHFFISKMNLYNLTFSNSDFLYLYQKGTLHNIGVFNTQFLGNSHLISTPKYITNEKLYQFFNVTFQSNLYSINTKFIALSIFTSEDQNVTMSKIFLLNNRINQELKENQSRSLNFTLIFIEAQKIYLNEILIHRAYGLIDLSIINSKFLRIGNSLITQGADYKFYGIHQNVHFLKGSIYSIVIFIYSAQYVEINQMEITHFQTKNCPIIFYQSEQKLIKNQKEQFNFNALRVTKTLIIQTQIEASLAIFYIISTQLAQLQIINCTFEQNILKFYNQIKFQKSALLFNFDTPFSQIIIQSSQFNSNLILDGNSSIISIKSKSVSIMHCVFLYNNYFYKILQIN